MDTSKLKTLGGLVARIGLPALAATLTTGPVGGAVAALQAASSALGVDPQEAEKDPEIVTKAIEADPTAALKLYELNTQLERDKVEALHNETMQEMQGWADALKEQATTARAELGSEDWVVRRARPFILWIIGLTWGYQMAGLTTIGLLAIWKHADKTAEIITAMSTLMGALSVMWSVALGVVGVYFKQRSNDKAVSITGQRPPTLIQSLPWGK